MDTTLVTFDEVSGRTRFANYRDGKLVSLFWKEAPGTDKRNRRVIGTRPTLDRLEERH